MIDWILQNIGTIIVLALVIAALAAAVTKIIKDKKNGKSCSCSGDCSSCPGCSRKK